MPSERCHFLLISCNADSVISDAKEWMSSQHAVNAVEKPQRVIVLNWMQDIEPLLADFAEFSPAGSEVVFVQEQRHQSLSHRVGSVRFRQVRHKVHMSSWMCYWSSQAVTSRLTFRLCQDLTWIETPYSKLAGTTAMRLCMV